MSVFVLIVVGMALVAWSLLRSPLVQTLIANQITTALSRTLNADVSVGKARFYIRKGLTMQDILVRCPNGDTLLCVPQLSGFVRSVDMSGRSVVVQRAYVRGARANIVRTDSVFNFSFLADSLKKNDTVVTVDTARTPWHIDVCELTMVQSAFTYTDDSASHHISNLNIDLSDFSMNGDTIALKLETLTASHNGVPMVENLKLDFALRYRQIAVSNLEAAAGGSHALMSQVDVFLPTESEPLHYKAAVEDLLLVPSDFAPIVPQLAAYTDGIALKGNIVGTDNKLRGRQLQISFADSSLLSADIALKHFRTPDSLVYRLTVNSLATSGTELANLLTTYTDADPAALQSYVVPLGNIAFSGKAEGTLANIDANGRLRTGLGSISLEAAVDKRSGKTYNVSSRLKSTPIAAGRLVGNGAALRLDISADGIVGDGSSTNLNVNGTVNDIAYAGRTIDSLTINGLISSRKFSGRLSSFDPNLRFDFDGLVNVADSQSYKFRSNVYYANLFALGLSADTLANLSFNLNANFSGPSIDLAEGTIDLTDIYYFRDSTYFGTDSVTLVAANANVGKAIDLRSEFVSAHAEGDFRLTQMVGSTSRFVRSFVDGTAYEPAEERNCVTLDVVLDYPHPVLGMFAPWFSIASGSRVAAVFDDSTANFRLKFDSHNIMAKSIEAEDIEFEMHNVDDSLMATLTTNGLYFADYESMRNIQLTAQLRHSLARLNMCWNNQLKNGNNSGNLNADVDLAATDGQSLRVDIRPSWITILDTTAHIQPATIALHDSVLTIDHFGIDNGTFRVFADGVLSDSPDDSLSVDVENVRLGFVSDVFGLKTKFSGLLSCQSELNDLRERVNGNLNINDFAIDGRRFGNISANTAWNIEERRLMVGGALSDKGGESQTTFGGYIDPAAFEMNLDAEATHQDVQFLKLFLSGIFSELTGSFSGKVHLDGRLNSPRWYGKVGLEDAHLTVRPTKATYIVSDTLVFDENKILFNNILGHDTESGTAQLNGSVWHHDFKEIFVDLKINADNVIALNTRSSDSPLWYGKTYGSGIIDIAGSNRSTVNIDISATTQPKSMFYITMEGRNDLTENDFITFVSSQNVKNIKEVRKSRQETLIEAPRSIVNLNLDLKVTPDAEVQIVFDPAIGDALRAHGSADLSIRLDNDIFSIYGTYLISNGSFTFTLQNVISKKLDLQSGSYLTWMGDPLGATINIDAAYKLRKVPVYSLTLNEEDREKRVSVNCHLLMTNKLVSPTIGFSIDVPSTITRIEEIEQLNSLPEDDLNQQVISLLLFNKFSPLTSASDNSAGTSAVTAGATTASELLSNQLSKWISQVSTHFDLGVAYRPETEISSEEYELALSTSLWNDRVTVSSNFDVNNQDKASENNTTQYTTDFSVELKLNKKGNVRLKAFQKVNEDIIYDDAPYTRGLGVFYTEDFNDFGELWRRWFKKKEIKNSNTEEPGEIDEDEE